MKQEDFNKVVLFYETVILQQIIKPIEINEIYSIIHPEVENPQGIAYKLKQRAISVFVQTRKAQVMKSFEDFLKTIDKTETNEPLDNPSIRIENPSHEEDASEVTKDCLVGSVKNIVSDSIESQIQQLQQEYLTAATANEKRSLSKRINNLRKNG